MTKQLLDRPNVFSILKQMCREAMTQRVTCEFLINASPTRSVLNMFAEPCVMQVVSPYGTTSWIRGPLSRWKDILPTPLVWCVWILLFQGVWEKNTAIASKRSFLCSSRTESRWTWSLSLSTPGRGITRSFLPLLCLTQTWLRPKSMSFILSRKHSYLNFNKIFI